jgi:hypothetical protein
VALGAKELLERISLYEAIAAFYAVPTSWHLTPYSMNTMLVARTMGSVDFHSRML